MLAVQKVVRAVSNQWTKYANWNTLRWPANLNKPGITVQRFGFLVFSCPALSLSHSLDFIHLYFSFCFSYDKRFVCLFGDWTSFELI